MDSDINFCRPCMCFKIEEGPTSEKKKFPCFHDGAVDVSEEKTHPCTSTAVCGETVAEMQTHYFYSVLISCSF